MAIRAVLFDLDGTLLDLDVDGFMPHYMKALIQQLAPGMDPVRFQRAVLAGTSAMIANDGRATNEEVFWSVFERHSGIARADIQEATDRFYREVFPTLSYVARAVDAAPRVVEEVKKSGAILAVATNPIFPREAILARLEWAKVDPRLFDFIASYESMHASKPNPAFFLEICDRIGVAPQEAVMIGNDPELDIRAARAAGLLTYLVEDVTPAGKIEREFAEQGRAGQVKAPAAPDGRGPLAAVPGFIRGLSRSHPRPSQAEPKAEDGGEEQQRDADQADLEVGEA